MEVKNIHLNKKVKDLITLNKIAIFSLSKETLQLILLYNSGNYYQLWSDFDLRYLDAKDNLITSLEYLSLLPSLQVVDLSLNKISVVEAVAFANKSNLRRVDLSSNDIERLPLAALSLDLRPKSK